MKILGAGYCGIVMPNKIQPGKRESVQQVVARMVFCTLVRNSDGNRNVPYLNSFDHYVKHELKATHYIRYADDFVLLSHDRNHLLTLLPKISQFLNTRLNLTLHPNKVSISTVASGVDFLGWTHFPDHRTLRTVTKRRLLTKLKGESSEAVRQSYFGLLQHGNGWKIRDSIT